MQLNDTQTCSHVHVKPDQTHIVAREHAIAT